MTGCGLWEICVTCYFTLSPTDRRALEEWMRASSCEPVETTYIRLDEGRFVARQLERNDAGEAFTRGDTVATVEREFVCAGSPPVWKKGELCG